MYMITGSYTFLFILMQFLVMLFSSCFL